MAAMGSVSSCSSSSHAVRHNRSCLHASSQTRLVKCCVSVSLRGDAPEPPDLASLNKLDLSNAMLLANLMRPPGQQLKPDRPQLNPDAASKPNEPIKVADFVHALECIVRSSGNAVNPEQLQEILDELLQANLLEQFTPQQLAASLKNLAVICTRLPEPVVESLIRQAGRQMALFTVPQLSNIGWALMRLAPVADAEYRQEYGLDQQWLQQYGATCEQQLQQVVEQQQPLPTGQQLANLLLVPAAVQQPLSPSGMQLLEQALLLSERRLCGMAVAQLLTCFVRLQSRPSQQVLDLLLHHLEEDLQLYDHDMLTQVAFGACVLQLRLPNRVLADITERADMLQASGQAEPSDVQLLGAAMDRLAKAALAETAPAAAAVV